MTKEQMKRWVRLTRELANEIHKTAIEKGWWDVPGALIAKTEMNKTRPVRHGGKKF